MTSRNAVRRSVSAAELPDFTPVPRKQPRHDGWTPERQRAFIEALADTGCVSIACRMVNMSQPSFYHLRRQPGAESFRAAADAAQALGLQCVKDEAFDRAMHGQLVPVFVGGKLMGFRRKKNDRLLMFILRHYGQDAGGRKTTVNYFSTRATAGAANSSPAFAGEGDHAKHGGGAIAEASTTTVKTVISQPPAPSPLVHDTESAATLNAFEGVELDPEAQAEIYRALKACAERRRALEHDPENDPERIFVGAEEAGTYLGELEGGTEDDWVEYRPEGEHRWEGLGEGGEAQRIDAVLEEMRRAREEPPTAQSNPPAALPAPEATLSPDPLGEPCLNPEQDPDDPRLDWRNWQDGGYTPPSDPSPRTPAEAGAQISSSVPSPRKAYKKRQPKPPFTPPDEAKKAEAVAAVEAERRELAAAEALRRERRKEG